MAQIAAHRVQAVFGSVAVIDSASGSRAPRFLEGTHLLIVKSGNVRVTTAGTVVNFQFVIKNSNNQDCPEGSIWEQTFFLEGDPKKGGGQKDQRSLKAFMLALLGDMQPDVLMQQLSLAVDDKRQAARGIMVRAFVTSELGKKATYDQHGNLLPPRVYQNTSFERVAQTPEMIQSNRAMLESPDWRPTPVEIKHTQRQQAPTVPTLPQGAPAQQGYAQPTQAYAQAPQAYAQAPQAYAQAPQAYAQAPQGYAQAPQAYAQAPQGYAPAPQGYAQPPQGYAQPPQGQPAGVPHNPQMPPQPALQPNYQANVTFGQLPQG